MEADKYLKDWISPPGDLELIRFTTLIRIGLEDKIPVCADCSHEMTSFLSSLAKLTTDIHDDSSVVDTNSALQNNENGYLLYTIIGIEIRRDISRNSIWITLLLREPDERIAQSPSWNFLIEDGKILLPPSFKDDGGTITPEIWEKLLDIMNSDFRVGKLIGPVPTPRQVETDTIF